MDEKPHEGPRLGSLAQQARSKNLRSARWILIVIGALTCAANGFLFTTVASQADKEIEKERKNLPPGMVVDEAKVNEAKQEMIRGGQLIYGGTVVLGLLFILLGIAVYRFPVMATVSGLVLYLAGNLVFFVLEPANIRRGALVKVIIVVALVKAIQSAVAYQREMTADVAPE